jgi:hypothetical protein
MTGSKQLIPIEYDERHPEKFFRQVVDLAVDGTSTVDSAALLIAGAIRIWLRCHLTEIGLLSDLEGWADVSYGVVYDLMVAKIVSMRPRRGS